MKEKCVKKRSPPSSYLPKYGITRAGVVKGRGHFTIQRDAGVAHAGRARSARSTALADGCAGFALGVGEIIRAQDGSNGLNEKKVSHQCFHGSPIFAINYTSP